MGNSGVKLDSPKLFNRYKQYVDDWLDLMDLYFFTETRIIPQQQVPRAVSFLKEVARK